MAKRYKVTLTQSERTELTRCGKTPAAKFLHARALLLCDAGDYGDPWKVADVAAASGITSRTVEHIKQRSVEEGLAISPFCHICRRSNLKGWQLNGTKPPTRSRARRAQNYNQHPVEEKVIKLKAQAATSCRALTSARRILNSTFPFHSLPQRELGSPTF